MQEGIEEDEDHVWGDTTKPFVGFKIASLTLKKMLKKDKKGSPYSMNGDSPAKVMSENSR